MRNIFFIKLSLEIIFLEESVFRNYYIRKIVYKNVPLPQVYAAARIELIHKLEVCKDTSVNVIIT